MSAATPQTNAESELLRRANGLPNASREFFLNEMERIRSDATIPPQNKVDCIVELATMCFENGFGAGKSEDGVVGGLKRIGGTAGRDVASGREMEQPRKRSRKEYDNEWSRLDLGSLGPVGLSESSESDGGRTMKMRKTGLDGTATSSQFQAPTPASLGTHNSPADLKELVVDKGKGKAVDDEERLDGTQLTAAEQSKNSAGGPLQNCPEDVLISIFYQLDAITLCRCSAVCQRWNCLISYYETSVWSGLTRRTWNISSKDEAGASWKQFYGTHHNLHIGRYTFASFRDNYEMSGGATTVGRRSAPPALSSVVHRKYVMAWPCDPNNAYIIAQDGNRICWVDTDTPNIINVADLPTLSSTFPYSDSQPITPTQTLEGHAHPIGLILSNMEGTLVSFDDSSTIMIWNLATGTFERAINTDEELGFIFSMNIYKRRIVTGGKNGKVIVWNADTGTMELSLDIPSQYLPNLNVHNLLNVAIWEDLIVYGLYDGTFYVYDCALRREIYCFKTSDAARLMAGEATNQGDGTGNGMDVAVVAGNHDGPNGEVAADSQTDMVVDTGSGSSSSNLPAEEGSSLSTTLVDEWEQELAGGSSHATSNMDVDEGVFPSGPTEEAGGPSGDGQAETVVAELAEGSGVADASGGDESHDATTSGDNSQGGDGGDGGSSQVPPPVPLPTFSLNPAAQPFIPLAPAAVPPPGVALPTLPAFPGVPAPPGQLQLVVPPVPVPLPAGLPAAPIWITDPVDPPLYPMTLALNGHVLLTNGPEKDQLALWDLSGRPSASSRVSPPSCPPPLRVLSETEALAREHFSVPPFRDLKFAEVSKDGTCVFGSVAFENDLSLLVWDFRERERRMKVDGEGAGGGKARRRRFEKRCLDGSPRMEFWVCYDEVEE
ncbi:hypothetical protein HK104_008871 [Borealophlyctis nickersoniae]|nr:hypothetical protein HK104_008871 [Borealophlyctis nickersoniae]